MVVIFPVFRKAKLLPYFLKYYSSIGATRFICALYQRNRNSIYEEIRAYKTKFDLQIESSTNCSITKFFAGKEAVGLNIIREKFLRRNEWYCIADLDEFHYFGGRNLMEMAKEAQSHGYSAVHGLFVDRIAKDGSLPPVGGILDERFPLACRLSYCTGVKCDKIALAKQHIAISNGHHETRGKTWRNMAHVHHFKWHLGVADEIKDRHDRYMRQGLQWAHRVYPKTYVLIKDGINLNMPGLQPRPAVKLGI